MNVKSRILQVFDNHARWYKKVFNKYQWVHLLIGVLWVVFTAFLDTKLGDHVAVPLSFGLFVLYVGYNVLMTVYEVKDVNDEEFMPDK